MTDIDSEPLVPIASLRMPMPQNDTKVGGLFRPYGINCPSSAYEVDAEAGQPWTHLTGGATSP